ncbi:MAG TPA: fused MFS/spermidine synthase [Burkholderiales bacterium]|nr:fused MFS/spermidine synthase [Burkholderiales bacterium]
MPNQSVKLLFALFTLSGFTGLIYESVWSHYLKLFLGAAAFAQSFVLAAFMGGLALGAWLASRWSSRLKNLLAAYGWIEAAIGVAALYFHEAYVLLTQASLDHVIPALGSPGAVEIFKYTLCAALIVPQTVLLGMTFPLLSGAVIRREPHASGHHLAMLYFTNSIGAAIGALAAAFWLLGWLGMPGTMRLAGALNLALAAAVLAIARGGEPAPFSAQPQSGTAPTGRYIARLFLAGAFVTGLASFVYEIVWIRMLSLVLGSSFHAFELMLSAFITGLALGGLWIRRRIDHIADPVRYAGLIQVVMGLAALATIFVYHRTFDWMEWGLGILQRNDSAYPVFNLFSHALAFAVMLPATFLAGMTLPLFTHVLLRGGGGERAIGQVYAANTLGAIAGVLIAVHVLVPEAGLKLALVLGAAADMLLGAWLLRYSQAAFRRAHAFAAVILGMLAATATARAEVLEPERLASGVFRYGRAAPEEQQVFFYRDGKTASVAVLGGKGSRVTISTNGKPDAAMYLDPGDPPTGDEYTMTLLAALPLLIKPDARSYANIGWGSGLTATVLLSHGGPREVHTIEIEPAMVAGARSFFPRNIRAYRDPRSQVYFEDAKSYFARHGRRYDVIISEPSNPWVNGVAGLFTAEFYRETKRYLAPEGLFVQWLQLYELNDRLLGSMLAALAESFADYEVYAANSGDLVVVAVAEGRVPRPGSLPEKEQVFMQQLDRIGIKRREEIAARSVGTKSVIAPLLAPLAPLINSDFHPLVQLEAPRARFQASSARAALALGEAPLPILEMAGGATITYLREPAAASELSPPVLIQSTALLLERGLKDRSADPLRVSDERARLALLALKQPGALCGAEPPEAAIEQLHWVATVTLSYLAPAPRRALWIERKWLDCAPARLSPHLRERLDVYAAIAARDARAMLERARALLAGPARGGDEWGRFLLLTAMLGGHVAGEHEEAGRLWLKYRTAFYPNGEIPPNVVYVVNLH